MRSEREHLVMPPVTAASTPPPELIVESPSSIGYTDNSDDNLLIHLNKDELEVARQLRNQLIVTNPDLASPQTGTRPLPVPPPKSETAPPTTLQLPIKLKIKEEDIKCILVKKESSPSVTFSPVVEMVEATSIKLEDITPSLARPTTAIPTIRRSAFRNVPPIITQTQTKETQTALRDQPKQLFWTNLRPDTPPNCPNVDDIPTVPNSP